MLVPAAVARGVAEGTVDLVFRRWAKPNVRPGDTLRTVAGVLAVDTVTPIDPATITDQDAARAGAASADRVRAALRGPAGTLTTYRVQLHWAGPDPRVALRADDNLSAADVATISKKLAAMDNRSTHGPWTHTVLRLIAEHPARRAGDLAEMLGRERLPFKVDVRKLKNLGLTHSLEVGYELAPRGTAYLAALDEQPDGTD